jgi:hypothetical protein
LANGGVVGGAALTVLGTMAALVPETRIHAGLVNVMIIIIIIIIITHRLVLLYPMNCLW